MSQYSQIKLIKMQIQSVRNGNATENNKVACIQRLTKELKQLQKELLIDKLATL